VKDSGRKLGMEKWAAESVSTESTEVTFAMAAERDETIEAVAAAPLLW